MKTLILHIPVIHKGFLDFLKNRKKDIGEIYLIDSVFLQELTQFKPDIASLEDKEAKQFLAVFGFQEGEGIKILNKQNIKEVLAKEIILVNDELSRNLASLYLKKENIEWVSVFLRWDKNKILSQQPLEDIATSQDNFDIEIMNQACKEAKKTGDWWRQVGAVLVKNGEIVLRGWNRDLPSDHTPYQVGEVRDFFKAGESQELASTIHGEQNIIAQAARKGISLEGASLYVTTFPCPVCAKLIACSGIKKIYFQEGGSNFDAKKVLESASVDIIQVPS